MPETPLTAIWNDSFTTVTSKYTTSAPIERVLEQLGNKLVTKVNNNFSLEPPLAAHDMQYQYHPANLEPTADIQSVGKDGLLVLARPNPEHSDRLKKSWDSIRKENKELKAVKDNTTSRQDHFINALREAVDDLRKIVDQQQAELAKEKTDRKVEQVRLEEKIERQEAQLDKQEKDLSLQKTLLVRERTERKDDLSTISQLTVKLIPLHLRVLLDLGRREVLKVVGADTWQDFCDNRNVHEITESIMQALANANVRHCPSRDAVEFLCCYNNVRREGNYQAHTASQEEMREAVLTKSIDSQERLRLTELYQFIFDSSV